MAKKCPVCEEGAPAWLLTYGDMITLVLTFFVLLYVTSATEQTTPKMDLVLSAFQGLGNNTGGNTLSPGRLAELGNTVNSLPSQNSGRALADSRRVAVSIFEPEIKRDQVRVSVDERGLVISLSADAFFDIGSAEIRKEEAREVLRKVGQLATTPGLLEKKIRYEGHTDSEPPAAGGKWSSNWQLGSERALSALIYTVEVSGSSALEARLHAASFGEYRPLRSNDTREGKAYNRRVDIVILNDGNL